MLRPDLLCLFLLLCFAVPFILRLVFGITHTVTIKETLVNSGILAVCCLILWVGGTYSSLSDVQILNGRITGKDTARVHCRHAYPCNCRQVSCGKNCTTTVCDTCYLHPYDVDWWAESTLGRFYIDKIDSQGLKQPPRWTAVVKDEPASKTNHYENYIKAAPDSLFHKVKYDLARYHYPDYPAPYDYYKINRVLGAHPQFAKSLNDSLNNALRELGGSKQANVVVAVTAADPGFADALKVHWLGGKKNDIIIVLGVINSKLSWVRVFSWAKNDIFNVQLRDELAKTALDGVTMAAIIEKHIKAGYNRKSMEEYKYLLDDFDPPMWLVIMMLIFGIGGSVVATFLAHRNEYFFESRSWRH
jgi:hypothetical protein